MKTTTPPTAGQIKRSRVTKHVQSLKGADIYEVNGFRTLAGNYVILWPETGFGEENRDWDAGFETFQDAKREVVLR